METMTTGRFPFSGGSVGSFVNHISPRCGPIIGSIILLQGEIPLGKFSPGSLFFYLLIAQVVVVGGNIGFQSCHLSLSLFLLKRFIQNRRLGIGAPPPRFLLQIRETRRGERKRASLFNVPVRVRHSTMYHTISMIISISASSRYGCEVRGRDAGATKTQQAASLQEIVLGLDWQLGTGNWVLLYPPFFNSISTCRAISFSVSNTPTP